MKMASMVDKRKQNFDFRMAKKVAELTQVVHMLFTRNHEKEVEIEAIKDAYELEIQIVIEDAEGRIEGLEKKKKDLEEQLSREKIAGKERVKSAILQEASQKEEEWKLKVEALEKLLQEEKSECTNLRDLLINAQKDIEKLREGVAEQLKSKNEEIKNKNFELEQLRRMVAELEKTQTDKEREYREAIRELEITNEKLEKELSQLQALLEDTHRNKLQLEAKTVKLETDLRNLKKDFGRKVAEVVASQQKNHVQPQPIQPRSTTNNFTNQKLNTSATKRKDKTATPPAKQDYNDEVEKLRREVQRYRMELTNRDTNFNRMFSDTNPLVIDPRAGKIGVTQNAVLSSQTTSVRTEPLELPVREKSFSYAFVQSIDDKRPSSSRVSSASARLPSLTQEQKTRLTKLMKPRPLSKEMLYGK